MPSGPVSLVVQVVRRADRAEARSVMRRSTVGAIVLASGAATARLVALPAVQRLLSHVDNTVDLTGTMDLFNPPAMLAGNAHGMVRADLPVTVARHVTVVSTQGATAIVSDETTTIGPTRCRSQSRVSPGAVDRDTMQAQQLEADDQLATAEGRQIPAKGIDWKTVRTGSAYNLTVADIHTCYWVADDSTVLVHNDHYRSRVTARRAPWWPWLSSRDGAICRNPWGQDNIPPRRCGRSAGFWWSICIPIGLFARLRAG